jgi:hypothetical protein
VCEYDRKYALRLLHSKAYLVEADTVAHCGTSMAGMFGFTLNTVDIATGWTEQRALWGKGEHGVLLALKSIEDALPFSLKGFDCDNGSEFMNWTILKHFQDRKRPVLYTRSREYRKNDNAHVSRSDALDRRKKLDAHPTIRLLSSGLKTDASVCLYDLPGHLSYTSKIENGNIYEINTSAIKAGLYVLNLKDEKQSISKKNNLEMNKSSKFFQLNLSCFFIIIRTPII